MPDENIERMKKAAEGGAEFLHEQAVHVADVAAREAARVAENPEAYPRVYGRGERWVDNSNPAAPREFIGTQYAYNTLAEALQAIDQARANGKDVLYMDPENGSYVSQGFEDFRVTIED